MARIKTFFFHKYPATQLNENNYSISRIFELLVLICCRQFKTEMFEVSAAGVASFSQVLFIQVLTSHFLRDVKGSIDS